MSQGPRQDNPGAAWRILLWRLSKRRRRLAAKVFGRLLREGNADMTRTVLVAGVARSGTTWLAEILSAQLRGHILFEPFNPELIPAYRQFDYFQFVEPGATNAALYEYCAALFQGRIHDRWIDRYAERLYPQYRIVKSLRAHLFLKWLHDSFSEVPLLFIIRHPCAVSLSRMKLGWNPDEDLGRLLSSPALRLAYLDDKMDIILGAKTIAEKNAVIWCILNLVPLRQFGPENLPCFFYEDMVSRPGEVLPAIFHHIGQEFNEADLSRLRRPSLTSQDSSAVVTGSSRLHAWQNELSAEQIASILTVVDRFGMDFLYGDSARPLKSAIGAKVSVP